MTKLKTVNKLLYKSGVSNAFLSYVVFAKGAHCPDFSIQQCRAAGLMLTELSLLMSHIVLKCEAILLLDKLSITSLYHCDGNRLDTGPAPSYICHSYAKCLLT